MKRDSNANERALIEQLQDRHSGAVSRRSPSAYDSKVYQLAFRYMKNREDAEEVTQDVLMKVVKKVDAFLGPATPPLSSWMHRITFNTAMSRLRNGKFTRPARGVRARDEGPGAGGRAAVGPVRWPTGRALADEAFFRTQLRGRLAAAMKDLPDILRSAHRPARHPGIVHRRSQPDATT